MSKLPPENTEKTTLKQVSSGPLGVAKFLIGTFSTVRQRDPPSSNKSSHIRFITVSVSHFCEKARWVFDHLEASDMEPYYFTEDAHPPPFQAYETLKASNQEASVTPMIVFEDEGKAKVIYDSTRILKKFMPELYPEAIRNQVEDMEADLGKRLGASLRCISYYSLFTDLKKYHSAIVQMTADPTKVANIESVLFDKFLPNGLADGMKESLKLSEETNLASLKALREVFTELSARLEGNGGPYLMDTKDKSYGFTAADLTLAALSYPILRPSEMSDWLVNVAELPLEINELTDELQNTRAGKHALEMYKKHRLPKGEKFVTMKYANRNKSACEGWFSWAK